MTIETETNLLASSLAQANEAQVDAVWAILKYREIGIYRKIACTCEVLNLDFEDVVSQCPTDEDGRVLDHKTRHLVHDALMELA